MEQTTTRINAVGRVMVPVTDQDEAIEFYTGTLGFELRADIAYGDGERWVEVAPAGADTAIALVPEREGNPAGVMTNVALTSTDVKADHADLTASGVDTDELIGGEGPVPLMFFFRDHNGNTLLLVQA